MRLERNDFLILFENIEANKPFFYRENLVIEKIEADDNLVKKIRQLINEFTLDKLIIYKCESYEQSFYQEQQIASKNGIFYKRRSFQDIPCPEIKINFEIGFETETNVKGFFKLYGPEPKKIAEEIRQHIRVREPGIVKTETEKNCCNIL